MVQPCELNAQLTLNAAVLKRSQKNTSGIKNSVE